MIVVNKTNKEILYFTEGLFSTDNILFNLDKSNTYTFLELEFSELAESAEEEGTIEDFIKNKNEWDKSFPEKIVLEKKDFINQRYILKGGSNRILFYYK